jgi:hypothetical protein
MSHHYCSHLNEDVRQCVIYDSDEPGARLIGVEYIISASLFQTLPMEVSGCLYPQSDPTRALVTTERVGVGGCLVIIP